MRTPHDDKIDAFAYSLAREGKPAYLPQLYETEDEPEAEPEEWPKENPLLSLAEDKEISEAFKAYTAALQELIGLMAATAALIETAQRLAVVPSICERIIKLCPNKRIIHLAKHAKKARTRKKNINRIIKALTTARSGPR